MFHTGNWKNQALVAVVAPKMIFVYDKVIDQRL